MSAPVVDFNSGRLPPNTMTVSDTAPFIELRGSLVDVGIFKDTLLPSFAIHSGLSLVAYGIGRYTDRVEVKDYVWPASQVFNAWFASIGRRVIFGGVPLGRALKGLSRPERLILSFVTIWGGRLLYRISSRAQKRGRDNPRYDAEKAEEGFWNKALLTKFLPEAAVQTIMTLPFTAPYYHQGGVFTGYHPGIQAVAVGVFCAGIFLETVADYQLDEYQESSKSIVEVNKEGVWSIVRHPNDMLAPIELLGPIANYLYIRYSGGEKQKKRRQSSVYQGEKLADWQKNESNAKVNSFWPDPAQVSNKWLWITIGAGALGAGIEQAIHLAGLN